MTEKRLKWNASWATVGAIGFAAMASVLAAGLSNTPRLGKQADGSFIVSSGQHIEGGAIPFDKRPIDMALHPSGKFLAVVAQKTVFLVDRNGVLPGTTLSLLAGDSYHGIMWTPDGKRCLVSTESGNLRELLWNEPTFSLGSKISCQPQRLETNKNPRPGGMAITRDGKRVFVALCDANAVAEIDLTTNTCLRTFPVQMLPFTVVLSEDEKTLLVSNWGGREPRADDDTGETAAALIVVDPRGVPDSGTVSVIDRQSGVTNHIDVGLHPTDIAVRGGKAYIACAASDAIAEVDIATLKCLRLMPLQWKTQRLFGSMPSALQLAPDGKTLYIASGGDNALAEMDMPSGKLRGYRPVGYYPVQLALDPVANIAYVLNTKGNGSVRQTVLGKSGNAHEFQGSLSIVDLKANLGMASAKVAANNGWNREPQFLKPNLKVYRGAIKHVLYIIKENRTYDEVFGDLPEGNGDASLCSLGKFMPNHRSLARQFTLFDNGYVSGTNSADGHAWSTQSVANDYLEHFYDTSRTYPDDGDCAMSLSQGGCIWDAAAKKGKSIRVYGEFCDDRMATFTPPVTSWMELWKDRQTRKIKIQVGTRVKGLKPYIHPEFVYWPLLQSDQMRADLFIDEYKKASLADRVPNLMVMSLPCDHTEGRNPNYPKPQSMVADNDLALGRIVEAVSKSPQWKDTCIFVIEDDAQSGRDHVDGHRTAYMAFSPYVKRKFVDSTMLTTVSMLRSVELMLGLDPMNRLDAATAPLTQCFSDTPDLSSYSVRANTVPLDDMNPAVSAQSGKELYWTKKSLALDWSGIDRADPSMLNRIIWHTVKGVDVPYPGDKSAVMRGVLVRH